MSASLCGFVSAKPTPRSATWRTHGSESRKKWRSYSLAQHLNRGVTPAGNDCRGFAVILRCRLKERCDGNASGAFDLPVAPIGPAHGIQDFPLRNQHLLLN